jgi:hypothetical protein
VASPHIRLNEPLADFPFVFPSPDIHHHQPPLIKMSQPSLDGLTIPDVTKGSAPDTSSFPSHSRAFLEQQARRSEGDNQTDSTILSSRRPVLPRFGPYGLRWGTNVDALSSDADAK